MTTDYPPPTAAYNKVDLSSNYAAAAPINTPAYTATTYCTGANNLALFVDGTGTLNQCTAFQTSVPYCAINNAGVFVNKGTVIADSNGSLHACMNGGKDGIYPQQCYNSFCSYDNTNDPGDTTCNGFISSPATICQPGFNEVPVDPASDCYDTFRTSPNTTVLSFVCCTNSSAGPACTNPSCSGPTSCGSYPLCSAPVGDCDCFGNPPGSDCDCFGHVNDSCGQCNGNGCDADSCGRCCTDPSYNNSCGPTGNPTGP